MIDEMFDRSYRAARADINASASKAIAEIGAAISESLRVLHRIEWSEPWALPQKRAGRAQRFRRA